MRILVDTNILLRFVRPEDPQYTMIRSAVRCLREQGNEICFAPQSMIEFWNVCTRPAERNGIGLGIAETDSRARVIESKFVFLPDDGRIHTEWRRLVVQRSVRGVQVHDARIVAAMLAHGVTHALTLNPRDFRRFTEITAVQPSDVVAA